MKKRFIGIGLILLIIVIISFVYSFIEDQKTMQKRKKVQEEVLEYLENKYNETFEIKSYSIEKVPYDINVVSDDGINNSNIYYLKVVSSRLIDFDVMYVEYLENDVYLENKQNDIMESGIYDNYIYQYKIKDIKLELKDEIGFIIKNIKDIDFSLSDVGNYYVDNLLIRQTLDSEKEIEIYNRYLNFNKNVSNLEFYNTTMDITNGDLIIDIDINDYITEDNLSSFKSNIVKFVNHLQKKGYNNYEINITFNKYQNAKVNKYMDDEIEKVYLLFDYESYSVESEDSKLRAYILEK